MELNEKLTKKFKKETGKVINSIGQPYTNDYVEWLENKLVNKTKEIPDVSQQRELLVAFMKWQQNQWLAVNAENVDNTVDTYIKNCSIHDVSKSFLCGKHRVYGDEKCKTQCSICKKDYGNE